MNISEIREGYPPLVKTILDGMEDVKAHKIMVLDLRKLENSVCDFFIISEGTSDTQVKAISSRIDKVVRENLNEKPWHVEGLEHSEWILMDYVNAVAHVFKTDTREFYDIEGLWSDAEICAFNEVHD